MTGSPRCTSATSPRLRSLKLRFSRGRRSKSNSFLLLLLLLLLLRTQMYLCNPQSARQGGRRRKLRGRHPLEQDQDQDQDEVISAAFQREKRNFKTRARGF